MHHLLYPSKDTFIKSQPEYSSKNFGMDEVLQVGTETIAVKTTNTTKTHYYNNELTVNQLLSNFTGHISGSGAPCVASSSVNIYISGNSFEITSSGFSGSYGGYIYGNDGVTNYPGAVTASVNLNNFIGNLSSSGYSINGVLSGYTIFNYVSSDTYFSGSVTSTPFRVNSAYISGSDIVNQYNTVTSNKKYTDRALIKFDITSISKSISTGNITNPKFSLRMWTSQITEIPIPFTIYAFPISQSWDMGVGYLSDSGADVGASWYYRDYSGGTPWYNTSSTILDGTIDFINDVNLATASFDVGGGTWYTSMSASQTYNEEVTDLNIDVTNIVNSWISGGIQNEGFILLSSEEVVSTPSYGMLKYFGMNTDTIYYPFLEVKWDDSIFVTGSIYSGSAVQVFNTGSINAYFTSGSIGNGLYNLSGSLVSGMLYSGSVGNPLDIVGWDATGMVVGAVSSSVLSGVYITGMYVGNTFSGEFSGAYSTSSYSYTIPILSSSLSPLNFDQPIKVIVENLRQYYRTGDVVRVNLFGREEFSMKTFNKSTQQDVYLIPKYLPSSSYYSIRDNETDEIYVDFDNYTKISCDASCSYFKMSTERLPVERYLRLLVRTEYLGSIYTFDDNNIFKVIR
jgi:hypothetical protein